MSKIFSPKELATARDYYNWGRLCYASDGNLSAHLSVDARDDDIGWWYVDPSKVRDALLAKIEGVKP